MTKLIPSGSGTYTVAPATVVDIINPSVVLTSDTEVLRLLAYVGLTALLLR